MFRPRPTNLPAAARLVLNGLTTSYRGSITTRPFSSMNPHFIARSPGGTRATAAIPNENALAALNRRVRSLAGIGPVASFDEHVSGVECVDLNAVAVGDLVPVQVVSETS